VGGAGYDQSNLTWRAWAWVAGKRAGVGACMSFSRTYVEAGMGRYGICRWIRHSTTETSIISYHPHYQLIKTHRYGGILSALLF
jgi:hypothetical protein